ncbi:hypothetical protein ACA910_009326 [Epithemia clementina (nom. ined.)]
MVKILSTRTVTPQGGILHRVQHASTSTQTEMIFSIFLPQVYSVGTNQGPTPAVYWLSGLTCTDENFVQKAGPTAFAKAEECGMALIMPDTSPRGDNVPNDDGYDLGQGAGFYINATEAPWSTNFQMESYIAELVELVESEWKTVGIQGCKAICGHSMGGHGALTLAFKAAPGTWTSVSAFSPVVHPTACPWGEKAFTAYLGSVEAGKAHDATELLLRDNKASSYDVIMIDEGTKDDFKDEQLKLADFEAAAQKVGQAVAVRRLEGHDHSYHFISAFIASHLEFHMVRLRRALGQAQRSSQNKATEQLMQADTTGKPIKCKAMVARGPKEPLVLEEITVDPPKSGEVRVKVLANALCHTDIYTLDGHDPEGLFPCILGHEAGSIVESVGEGVTSVKPGDKVIPCYTPQCNMVTCIFCRSPKTNLCPTIRGTQGQGKMPDGTVRFKDKDGKEIYHFMGCSTMSEYTVLAEISCAKISDEAPLEKVCLFGCGVSTGLGAVFNTCKVAAKESVAVFGLGAVGLAVIQAARMAGASPIFAIDVNPSKFDNARSLGATHCVNPKDLDEGVSIQKHIAGTLTPWGVDYSFDCTGNTEVMRSALECAHRGWGTSCVIGVAAAGHEISTRPFQLVTGRVWKGTAFGGYKSRSDVPKLVEQHLSGDLPIDHFITNVFKGVASTNDAIHALHSGSCLRAVVHYG